MDHIIQEFKQISTGCEDIFHTVIGNYLEGLPPMVDSGWNYKLLGMNHYFFSSSDLTKYSIKNYGT